MDNHEQLQQIIEFALPKPCLFGEENFAGDPLVRAFCDMLRAGLNLDFRVFVAWECPPDVKVLRNRNGSTAAVIRSERLDTLLIEYFHLRRFNQLHGDEFAWDVTTAAVLRWMAEFLIAYREPELAILAQTLKPPTSDIRLYNPFRDQTLESLPELERAAIQCFCLGHEVGHLVIPKKNNVTLAAVIDGISLAQHISTQEQQETGLSDYHLAGLARLREDALDAGGLLNEVEVDLFAFEMVVDFLRQAFECSVSDAIEATMLAFECQAFIYGCKGTCRILAQAATRILSSDAFAQRDYLMGVELAARARAVVRRAGILWAMIEHPTPPPGGRDYNAYVHRIDEINRRGAPLGALAAQILNDHAHMLLAMLDDQPGTDSDGRLNGLLQIMEHDSELRLDFFYILIAFGCPGSVDPVAYLRQMRPPQKRQ